MYTYTQDDFTGLEVKDEKGLVVANFSATNYDFLAGALVADDLRSALELALQHLPFNGKHVAVFKAKAALAAYEETRTSLDALEFNKPEGE